MQQRAEGRGRFDLHVRQDVRVDFHRHRDRRVAEPLADDVHRRSRLQQQRRAGVPQTVELDPPARPPPGRSPGKVISPALPPWCILHRSPAEGQSRASCGSAK
jgi:hypothetical protein